MTARSIRPLPRAPRGAGLLGELDALHAALGAAGATVDLPVMLGVSGLAFAYGFRVQISGEGRLPQFGWFRPAMWDGPDPLRLAARLAGFDYTAHLVNSTSGMFTRVVDSISRGVPLLTFDPDPPHAPALCTGYDCGEALSPPRRVELLRQSGEAVWLALPDDPEDVLLELGPWRNFVGVAEHSSSRPDDAFRRRQILAALRRVSATAGTAVIGDALTHAGSEMPTGDTLDEETRGRMQRPSFAAWARIVREATADVPGLRVALDDVAAARDGAAGFLDYASRATGTDFTAARDTFTQLAAGLRDARRDFPDNDAAATAAMPALATRLVELHELEARGLAALRDALAGT